MQLAPLPTVAITGSGYWLRPDQVTRMTDVSSRQTREGDHGRGHVQADSHPQRRAPGPGLVADRQPHPAMLQHS